MNGDFNAEESARGECRIERKKKDIILDTRSRE